jgi:CRP-like cAMP-binding protein
MSPDLLSTLPPGRAVALARGETLFRAGDPAIGLVLVQEGVLELVRTSPEGRRLVLHRAGPGDTFAEASLFETYHHCDAVAAMPSRMTVYAASDLRRAAETDPTLGWRIAAHLAMRLVAERARAERLALPHAADRILDVLHALPPEPDGARRLDRSWKTLAAELGLSHEATYRALARLEQSGRLQREGDGRVRLPAAAVLA